MKVVTRDRMPSPLNKPLTKKCPYFVRTFFTNWKYSVQMGLDVLRPLSNEMRFLFIFILSRIFILQLLAYKHLCPNHQSHLAHLQSLWVLDIGHDQPINTFLFHLASTQRLKRIPAAHIMFLHLGYMFQVSQSRSYRRSHRWCGCAGFCSSGHRIKRVKIRKEKWSLEIDSLQHWPVRQITPGNWISVLKRGLLFFSRKCFLRKYVFSPWSSPYLSCFNPIRLPTTSSRSRFFPRSTAAV